jgi:WD40 repeat protein
VQHSERITALVVLHRGQLLFSSGNDRRLIIWDLEKRLALLEIPTESAVPLALAVNADETILAVGTDQGHILSYACNTNLHSKQPL